MTSNNIQINLQINSSCLFSSWALSFLFVWQEQYHSLVTELLKSQTVPEYKERLTLAFNQLTPPSLSLTLTPENKHIFMENFDRFLMDVRGFLCVRWPWPDFRVGHFINACLLFCKAYTSQCGATKLSVIKATLNHVSFICQQNLHTHWGHFTLI